MISRYQTLKAGDDDVLTTSGNFLTIRGMRDVKNSRDYDVEFTVRAVRAASKLLNLLSFTVRVKSTLCESQNWSENVFKNEI